MQYTDLQPDPTIEPDDEQPPILGSWNRIYALVLLLHALFITLFYLFTLYYS